MHSMSKQIILTHPTVLFNAKYKIFKCGWKVVLSSTSLWRRITQKPAKGNDRTHQTINTNVKIRPPETTPPSHNSLHIPRVLHLHCTSLQFLKQPIRVHYTQTEQWYQRDPPGQTFGWRSGWDYSWHEQNQMIRIAVKPRGANRACAFCSAWKSRIWQLEEVKQDQTLLNLFGSLSPKQSRDQMFVRRNCKHCHTSTSVLLLQANTLSQKSG